MKGTTIPAGSHALLASLLLLLAALPAALGQRNSNKDNGAAFTAAPQPLHPDADLLLAFRASLDNGEEKLPDWKREVSPCYWAGLQCNSSLAIIDVDLHSKDLKGKLPSGGWLLPDTVEHLDVSTNDFTGTIPWTFKLPDNLRELWFWYNSLTGSIPENWTLPSGLQVIDLDMNALTGTIPEGLVLPDSLTYVDFDANKLSGTLPPNWTLPASLEKLYLNDNELTGAIPKEWEQGLPSGVEEVWLYNNRLEGTLPSWEGRTGMQVLVVPGNQGICGDVPPAPQYYNYSSRTAAGALVVLPNCPPSRFSPNGSFSSMPSEGGSSSGSSSDSSGTSIGIIVGPVVGAAAICALAGFVGFSYWRRRRRRQQEVSALKEAPLATLVNGDPPSGSNTSTADLMLDIPDSSSYPGPKLQELSGWCSNARRNTPDSSLVSFASGSPRLSSNLNQRSESAELLAFDPLLAILIDRMNVAGRLCGGGSSSAAAQPPAAAVAGTEGAGAQPDREQQALPSEDATAATTAAPAAPAAADSGPAAAVGAAAGSTTAADAAPAAAAASAAAAAREAWDAVAASSTGGLRKVDVSLWFIPFQDLQFKRHIGEGSYARVYLARWKCTNVAVKILMQGAASMSNIAAAADVVLSPSSPVLASLQQEASLMASLRHPNVLGFMGVVATPPCLVSEWCPRGSLFEILTHAPHTPSLAKQLTWSRRVSMALAAATGMNYLHSHSPALLHRDLKSPNILVDTAWNCKVADFNLSRLLEEHCQIKTASTSTVANPHWLAPEVLAGGPHSFASDCFSFGVVLWELLTWRQPWTAFTNPWQMARFVIEGGRLEVPPREQLPGPDPCLEGLEDYVRIIHGCWEQLPEDRPDFQAIVMALRRVLALAAKGSRERMLAEASSSLAAQAEASQGSVASHRGSAGLDGAALGAASSTVSSEPAASAEPGSQGLEMQPVARRSAAGEGSSDGVAAAAAQPQEPRRPAPLLPPSPFASGTDAQPPWVGFVQPPPVGGPHA